MQSWTGVSSCMMQLYNASTVSLVAPEANFLKNLKVQTDLKHGKYTGNHGNY